MMRDCLRLMRPHHYIKNLFLFLPLFFSGRLAERVLLLRTAVGFVGFCLICSVVYIVNDILDAERDRNHSVKRSRPVASGAVSAKRAIILASALLALGLAVQAWVGWANPYAWLYLVAYLLMNLAYSWRLKHVAIVDVSILAAGFLLRLAYGASLGGIAVSGWLFLTVLALSFYLGLGKRRGEILRQEGTRPALAGYTEGFLDKSKQMCLTLTVAFYSLWAAEGGGMQHGATRPGGLIWTVPLVIVLCLKYSLDLENGSEGDPVEVLLGDKLLCVLALLFAAAVFLLIYAF